jgi:ATP-binding cassette subfamily B protein
MKTKTFDVTALGRIFSFVTPYRRRFYFSIFLAIALAAIAPLRPYLIEVTVNDYIQHDMIRMLILITEWQIGLIILETVLRFYFTFITAWLGQSVVRDLRVTIFDKILRLNLAQFDTTPLGTLTTRTINDIETINDIFAEGLIPIVADLLSIVAVLVSMCWMNWRLTLVCLAPFPVLVVATYYFKETVNRSFIRVRNAVAALNAFVQKTGSLAVSGASTKNTGTPTSGPFSLTPSFFRSSKSSSPCRSASWSGTGRIRPWIPFFRTSNACPVRSLPSSCCSICCSGPCG